MNRQLVPAGETAGVATATALVADGWRSLAEAGPLPDIRRVMEVATVAAEAARRVARLAESESSAAEIVVAANEAANDAAALRIEAMAKAGELLLDMQRRGNVAAHGGDRRSGSRSRPSTLIDLGVTRNESSVWRRIAGVPVEVRRSYFDETTTNGGEVTTAGMLRHAATPPPLPPHRIDHAAIHAMAQRQIRRAHQHLSRMHTYRPDALVAALKPRERAELEQTLPKLRAWVVDVEAQLAAYRPTQNTEVQ